MTTVTGHAAPSILLVDDDETLRERLARALRERGYDVRTAGNADQAMQKVREDSPELAVLDLKMPGRSGIDLLKEIRAYNEGGKLLRTITGQSVPTARFETPMGIAVDAARKDLVVTDLEHRVVRIPYGEER